MAEYNLTHTGAELDEAINKVKVGYILPQGTAQITENGSFDVTGYAGADVNVSSVPTLKFAEFELSLAETTATAQYSSASHIRSIADVGFTPKFYIFTPWDYSTSLSIIVANTSDNPIIMLTGVLDDTVTADAASFLNKGATYYKTQSYTAASVVATQKGGVSVRNSSLKLSDDKQNLYYYNSSGSASYPLNAGKWRLQLVGW